MVARIVSGIFFIVDLQNILMAAIFWPYLQKTRISSMKFIQLNHCASASFPYQATQENYPLWPFPGSRQQRPKDLILGLYN